MEFKALEGKKVEIKVGDNTYLRHAIETHYVQLGESYVDLIKKYGVDSYLGRLAATLQGSTDTTIYVLSLYFGSIGIKKIRYSLWAGLLTDLMAIIISIVLVNLMF